MLFTGPNQSAQYSGLGVEGVVVDAAGGAPFSTITQAIAYFNAHNAAGRRVIYVMPGAYAESFTVPAAPFSILGMGQVEITGTVTLTDDADEYLLENLQITSAAAGTCIDADMGGLAATGTVRLRNIRLVTSAVGIGLLAAACNVFIEGGVPNGAGAAGIAITKLLLAYGYEYITLCDTKGAIYKDRADLNDEKIKMAEVTNVEHRAGLLGEIIAGADIFIGVSKADVLTKEMVSSMAPRPIIFAMANPNPEILPDNAKKAGAFIVATGRSDFPNQVNNALVFPGLFKGALDNGLKRFDHSLFIKAAEALASVIKNPDTEHILPSPFDEGVVAAVAEAMK